METESVRAIFFVLGVYGLTNIVTTSSLFEPVRRLLFGVPFFGSVIKCSMCFGFWAGILISLMGFGVAYSILVACGSQEAYSGGYIASQISSCLMDGWVASGVAWLMIGEGK